VKYDENGECIIIFPPEFCEQTDQREGDLYDLDVVDGRIMMTFLNMLPLFGNTLSRSVPVMNKSKLEI
jgi:hypothetical protein